MEAPAIGTSASSTPANDSAFSFETVDILILPFPGLSPSLAQASLLPLQADTGIVSNIEY